MINYSFQRILIIQTAFIGDVILITPLLEKLHHFYPDAKIDLLVRKGNESLFKKHPFIHDLIIWDKKNNKLKNLLQIAFKVRKKEYDLLINCQRFFSSGLIALFSGADFITGFDKNPLALFYNKKVKHFFDGRHEAERNLELIECITDKSFYKPSLYPANEDYHAIDNYKMYAYITVAPTSVWYTKQFPPQKWIEFIDNLPASYRVYLLGSLQDKHDCNYILKNTIHSGVINLSGELSLLQSAALMENAEMNYVNDSAPLHLCSAVNAPVCAVFCSTVPYFGYGPLSDNSYIVETYEKLDCRPCGIHGYNNCPLNHFKCALSIDINQLTAPLK